MQTEPKQYKRKGCQTLDDAYKAYKKDNWGNGINVEIYRKVVNIFVKKVINHILQESGEVNLGSFLGLFRIKKCKLKFNRKSTLYVDWKKTNELREETGDYTQFIYHMNEHTRGYYYKWFWNKGECRVPNKAYYAFVPTQSNKRALAKIVGAEFSTIDYRQ